MKAGMKQQHRPTARSRRGHPNYFLLLLAVMLLVTLAVPIPALAATPAGANLGGRSFPPDAVIGGPYILTVNSTGNGTVAKSPDQASYTTGSSVNLTATPDPGWEFSGWSGNLSGSVNPTAITIDTDKTVTANFVLIPPVTYILTVNSTGNGTIAKSPDEASYATGTSVNLTASPGPGWEFSGWSGDLSGSANPATITMDADKTVTASFAEVPPETYSLTVDTVGSGSVTKSPDEALYTSGASVNLTATPDPGWEFTGWSGNLSGSANPATITMDAAKTVTATFITRTLTVNTIGNGTVTRSPDQVSYTSGTSVNLTASPDAGWEFSGWSDDLSGSANPATITMDAAKNVTATFITRTLTVNTIGNGTVTRSPDQASYTTGTVVTLTAIPAPGWHFYSWNGDLYLAANPATLTMDKNKNVQATFEQDVTGPYTVDTQEIGNGTVTLSPDWGVYDTGTSVNITATADPGWTFIGWGGSLTGTMNPASMVIDSDKLILANFVADSAASTGYWWNDTWTRRQEITVTENSGADLLDYQVKIHVPYEFDMQPDFSDIRFINPEGSTELPYWRDNIISDVSADFWVKLPYLPASGTVKLYMYYGNPVSTTTSNIHDTFVWADDFSNPAWTYDNINMVNYPNPLNGDPSNQYPADGVYVQEGAAASEPIAELFSGESMTIFPPSYIAEVEVKPDVKTGNTILCPRYLGVDNKYECLLNIQFDSTGLNKVVTNNWAFLAGSTLLPNTIDTGTWYTLAAVVTREGGTNRFKVLVDGTQYIEATDSSLSYTGLALITYDADDNDRVSYDNLRVRQYAAVEPASSFSSEQTYQDIQKTLTVNVIGQGTVLKSLDLSTYEAGTTLNLTATPIAHWQFKGWSGDFSGSDNPASLTMDANKMITATFVEIPHTLTLLQQGEGSVFKDPDLPFYPEGRLLTISASGAPGWSFTGWSGDIDTIGDALAPVTTILMDTDKTVSATFTRDEYTLDVHVTGGGAVTESPEQATYLYGDSVNLTAVPQVGWIFSNWSGDLSGNDNPAAITITGSKALTAVFTRIHYTVSLKTSGNGTITLSPANGPYLYGDSVQLTAHPAQGWRFYGWSGDLTGVDNPASMIINGNKTVMASFAIITATPPASNGGGSGGGGGGGAPGLVSLAERTDANGVITIETKAFSADGNAFLILPVGTLATQYNAPATAVTVFPLNAGEAPPAPPENMTMVAAPYRFGPEGMAFNPHIILNLKYNPALLPAGTDLADLTIGWWDPDTAAWVPLATTWNEETGYLQALISHFSLYGVLAGTAKPDISLDTLQIDPPVAYPDEPVTVNAEFVNAGTVEGSVEATLSIDGAPVETKGLSVPAGETATALFEIPALGIGVRTIDINGQQATIQVVKRPSPASFAVSALTVSAQQVDVDQPVIIHLTITNSGETEGDYPLELKANGEVVYSQTVALAGGASQDITVARAFRTAGEVTLGVGDQTSTLEVFAQPPTLANTTTPTTSAIAPVVTTEPSQTSLVSAGDTKGSNWSTWIIFGGAALAVVMVAVVVIARRRRNKFD